MNPDSGLCNIWCWQRHPTSSTRLQKRTIGRELYDLWSRPTVEAFPGWRIYAYLARSKGLEGFMGNALAWMSNEWFLTSWACLIRRLAPVPGLRLKLEHHAIISSRFDLIYLQQLPYTCEVSSAVKKPNWHFGRLPRKKIVNRLINFWCCRLGLTKELNDALLKPHFLISGLCHRSLLFKPKFLFAAVVPSTSPRIYACRRFFDPNMH
jgi:hypothetical protein